LVNADRLPQIVMHRIKRNRGDAVFYVLRERSPERAP
jgi:hypothetical protein